MKNRGITLIVLVITIIVLLILAGVSLSLTLGKHGILTQAKDAKIQTEIAEEKDILNFSELEARGIDFNKRFNESEFQSTLDKNAPENNKAHIIDSDDEKFTVKFDSKRYYYVYREGNIQQVEGATGEKVLTIECINSKNEVLAEYNYTILENKYSKKSPKVAGYEARNEKLEGDISKNITIKELYYLVCDTDETLIFSGLDSNGNITTNENEISSYMLGDNSNTYGNALKDEARNIAVSVKIPDEYKGKPVSKLGVWSFLNMNNVKKFYLSNNIEIIGNGSIDQIPVEEISFGNKLKEIENYGVWGLQNLKKISFSSSNFKFSVNSFGVCSKWKEIEINENNPNYAVLNNTIYTKDYNKLILVPKGNMDNFEIKDGIKIISEYSFANVELKNLDIPDSVTTIEQSAFNATHLESIKIGKNVSNIGNGQRVFWNSTKLKEVTIDSKSVAANITNQMSQGALVYYAETIYIKSDIENIGNYITDNYNLDTSDKNGYIKYVKK